MRPLALVTGASGGMGRAGARAFGNRYRLFLTDMSQDALDPLVAELTAAGIQVAGVLAADMADPRAPAAIVAAARAAGPLSALFHTAGLSPALAGAEAILAVNLVATDRLLRAIEDGIEPGLAAVLVASMAAALTVPDDATAALYARPDAADFPARARALLGEDAGGAAMAAYGLSKHAVVRLAERRAAEWARSGARIVSVSPGMIDTTMGRREVESTPGAAMFLQATPLGWGTPDDIAAAALFLCSDGARFITGCDLRIDGGVVAAFRSPA